MTDFRPDICTNLRIYPGIVEEPHRIETLNDILNDLDALGFSKLVQNFCTQPDPEKARDFLFEIWLCRMLLRNQDVQDLQYEPPDSKNPPDFRFLLHGVGFDLQVKRLHNVTNELTKLLFERECQRLSAMPKPWFINFWVSDHFTPQHLNPFFTYLKRSIDQFSPVTTLDTLLGEPQYSWEQDGTTLIRFSFTVKRSSTEPGIFPGVIVLIGTENSSIQSINTATFRRSVERLLKKSRASLKRPVSPTQANPLVMQSVHFLFADKKMPDTLYGDEHGGWHRERGIEMFREPNGLFRPNKFSNICGLILVPSKVWFFSERFEGDYFPHPSHILPIRRTKSPKA